MFKTEEFNDLPKSILSRVPPLSGQTVKFCVRGGFYDHHNGGVLRFPYIKTVPSTDLIVGDNNEVFQIAHITRNGGTPQMIMFENANAGHIIISPDAQGRYRPSDIVMYEYLMLCNFNGSNPYRDASKEAIFDEVNDAKVAEKKVEAKLTSIDLIRRIATLGDDEVRLVAGKFGVSEPGDSVQAVRVKLMDAAAEDHERLDSIINQVAADGEHLINVQRAIDRNVIYLDKRNFVWKWKTTRLDIREGDRTKSLADNITSLARWLKDTDDGSKVYPTILTAIS